MAKWAYRCLAILITIGIPGLAMSSREPNSRQPDRAAEQFGPSEGMPAPPFNARDQFGNEQTLKTLTGKNGTALLFFRSADW